VSKKQSAMQGSRNEFACRQNAADKVDRRLLSEAERKGIVEKAAMKRQPIRLILTNICPPEDARFPKPSWAMVDRSLSFFLPKNT
jgi:hypothetical protein